MMTYISALWQFIKRHLWTILLYFPLTIFFFVMIFPFEDLRDFVTEQVSLATFNKVYLKYEDMSFTAMPQPGLSIGDVSIQSSMAPNLKMDRLSFAPYMFSVFSLMKNEVFGKATAEGLFGGEVNIASSSGNLLKLETTEYELEVDADDLDFKKLTSYLKTNFAFPFVSTGSGNADIFVNLDPTFKIQPDGTFKMLIDSLDIPAFSVPIGAFGALPLPEMKFTKVDIQGQLKDRRLIIKEGKLGGNKDGFYGTITGEVSMTITQRAVRWGAYDLEVKLNLKKDFQEKIGTILSIMEGFGGIGTKFKTKSLNGVQYAFKVSGSSWIDPRPKFRGL